MYKGSMVADLGSLGMLVLKDLPKAGVELLKDHVLGVSWPNRVPS